jgi:hypothetical protein
MRRQAVACWIALGAGAAGACSEVIIVDGDGEAYSSATSTASVAQSGSGAATSVGAGAQTTSVGSGGGATSTTVSTGAGGMTSAVTSGAGGSTPGEISDVFDPLEVYLLGTVQPGSSGRDAMAHWADPNTAAIGFIGAYDSETAHVQENGKLIYVHNGDIREFVCDACPYVGVYANGSDSNDPILPTSACMTSADDIKVGPGGVWLHSCFSDWNEHWYDAAGVLVYGDEDDMLLQLGYSNLALTESRVVDLADASSVPIVGLPAGEVLAVRALAPDAFLLALAGQDDGAAELWQIDATGIATLIGAYPPLPAGYTVQPWFAHRHHALEPTGALLQIGEGPMVFQDVIVRREVGGASTVVYDEATNPVVQIHISGLVTGP